MQVKVVEENNLIINVHNQEEKKSLIIIEPNLKYHNRTKILSILFY